MEVDLVVHGKAGSHRLLSKGRALSMKGVNKWLVVLDLFLVIIVVKEALAFGIETPGGKLLSLNLV